MLREVEQGEDPWKCRRRSGYVPPPKWKFSCKEILDEVDTYITRASLAVGLVCLYAGGGVPILLNLAAGSKLMCQKIVSNKS